jgi:hypothetical protein
MNTRLLNGLIATAIFLLAYTYTLYETSIPEAIGLLGAIALQFASYLVLEYVTEAR